MYDDVTCLISCDPTLGVKVGISTGATTTGIDFALTKGGRIAGQVTSAATGLPLGIARLAGRPCLGCNPTTGTAVSVSLGATTIGIDFALDAGGRVAGVMTDTLGQVYDNVPCLGCDPTTGTAIPVSAGATSAGIDFQFEQVGRIAGRVTDASGRPIWKTT